MHRVVAPVAFILEVEAPGGICKAILHIYLMRHYFYMVRVS